MSETYKNDLGNPWTLIRRVRAEPEWAANRIRAQQQEIGYLKRALGAAEALPSTAEAEQLMRDFDARLHPWTQWSPLQQYQEGEYWVSCRGQIFSVKMRVQDSDYYDKDDDENGPGLFADWTWDDGSDQDEPFEMDESCWLRARWTPAAPVVKP